MTPQHADLCIIGAGAAGLFAGIFAARTYPNKRIILLDGAKKLGAKILVAGGGRCNVTHDVVNAEDYAGGSKNAIRKVLKRFDVEQTTAFFKEMGVSLKREETGKLFPTTDDSKTILNALLHALKEAGGQIHHPYKVESLRHNGGMFEISGAWGTMQASHVILATGGKALPKSGSDGSGYALAQSLGHTLTDAVFPALVPLILPGDHPFRQLSGIAIPATLEVWDKKRRAGFTNSLLLTHFGLSGPAALDISRHWIAAQPDARLIINFLPEMTSETFDALLQNTNRQSIGRILTQHLPERLARVLCEQAELSFNADQLTKVQRRNLVEIVTAQTIPISGNRGFTYAEVTAGGIPLTEIRLETMESRLCEGLHLCGEICDVDGRIGGYNFQWAWSSGYVAGISAMNML
mgnify:CR=1 FL=1